MRILPFTVSLAVLFAPSPAAATQAPDGSECREDEYVVVPVGAGYLDVRVMAETEPSHVFLAVWLMLYAEAGGAADGLERGDDLDVLGTPADQVCGDGLMPPVVDDLVFAS